MPVSLIEDVVVDSMWRGSLLNGSGDVLEVDTTPRHLDSGSRSSIRWPTSGFVAKLVPTGF